MSFAELIHQLGQQLNITDLSLSEDNTCGVIFDNDDVLFENTNNNIFIVSEIGRVEEEERDKLFAIFMDANHLGHGTAYGSIGYDAQRDIFTLTRVLTEDIEYKKFEEQLVLFLKALRYWKRYIQNGDEKEEQSESNNDSLSMLQGLS